MDKDQEKKFSFPNSDSYTSNNPQSADFKQPRPLVHISDALNIVKKKENNEPNIRTFQADIANAIKNDNVSMIQVALSEKKRQEKRGNFDEAVEVKKNTVIFYASSIGVAVFIVIAFSFFIMYMTSENKSAQTSIDSKLVEPIIYTESLIELSTNNRDSDDLERLLKKEKEVTFELGTMKSIILTSGTGTSTEQLTLSDFLTLMKARVSESLIRSLDSNFLLGLYSFSPYDTFMVIKVNSYDNAFAGMLQWESSLENDIGGIIITKRVILNSENTTPGAATVPGQTASTTAQGASGFAPFKKHVFIDKVVQNKDSRVLIDERGTTLMLYSFLDKNTLVIASSDKALKEVLFRLTTGRIVR